MELSDALERATADLQDAEAQLRAAEGRVRELQAIRDGLRFAMAKYEKRKIMDQDAATATEGERVAVVHDQTAATDSLRVVREPSQQVPAEAPSQTSLAYTALQKFHRPASTHEVREQMVADGYNYSHEQVRNALTYLMRSDRIKRVAPGTWEIAA